MLHDVVFLILGLTLIILGGNYVTDGAVAVAQRLKLSPMVIGLTIVAFGSSTPDLVVGLISVFHNKGPMAVGNEVGAVIFDMFLVVGIMAILRPVVISKTVMKYDMPVMVLGAFALSICATTSWFDSKGFLGISRIDGVIMITIFLAFTIFTILKAKKTDIQPTGSQTTQNSPSKNTSKSNNMLIAAISIVGGFAGLVIGGQWTVDSASVIARHIGMSEALIGLTIVGVGGSLPDLVSSVIAVLKNEPGLALGNVVGSCIMDLLFVLGTCAIVKPLDCMSISSINFITLSVAAVLLYVFGRSGNSINRNEGIFLTVCYAAYIAYLIITR